MIIKILGQFGSEAKAAIPVLASAIRDRFSIVSGEAAEALANIGSDAVPALVEALTDDNVNIRTLGCIALGEIGPDAKAAVPALISELTNENEQVRDHAADALKKVDPEAAAKAGLR